MKANRKFVEEKEAVSAVIGVILMVAITVAMAAAVFVYVSNLHCEEGYIEEKVIKENNGIEYYFVLDNTVEVKVNQSVYYQYDVGDYFKKV